MRSALNSVCAGLILLVAASAQIHPSAQIGRGVPVRGEIETSIVLAKMRRFHEAAEVARRALRVLPGMAKMQYLLAVCLLADHKESAEAIKNLRSASAEIPKAHLVAAEALVDDGKPDEAVLELEQYLATKPKDEVLRAKVEARITELKH